MDRYTKGFLILASLILSLLFLVTPAFGALVLSLDLNRNEIPEKIVFQNKDNESVIYFIEETSDAIDIENSLYTTEGFDGIISSVTLIEDSDNDGQPEILVIFEDDTDEVLLSDDLYQDILSNESQNTLNLDSNQNAVVTVAVSESADCTLNPSAPSNTALPVLLLSFFALLVLLRRAKAPHA